MDETTKNANIGRLSVSVVEAMEVPLTTCRSKLTSV
jgi:hypothetical protein